MPTLQLAALSPWWSALVVVVLPTVLAIAGASLVRRRVGLERLVINNEVAGFKFAVVGVIYAVLLGFAVIVVWEKFRDAESAATREAEALVTLYRLAGGVEPADAAALRDQLTQYARGAVEQDWPAMAQGRGSPSVNQDLNSLYATVLADRTRDRTGAVVLAELFRQLDAITQARRDRIGLAGGIVPSVVWEALLLGAMLTIGFTFFFGVQSIVAQILMTGALSALIFLGLQVIVSIDHPFTGPVSVSPEPLLGVLAEFGHAGG